MCTSRKVIYVFIIVFGIFCVYFQYKIKWTYSNFANVLRNSKDDQVHKCDANVSYRAFVINIFLGRNFIDNSNDGKYGTLRSLLISLKDAKNYYLKTSYVLSF